jgi:hypothetical protein
MSELGFSLREKLPDRADEGVFYLVCEMPMFTMLSNKTNRLLKIASLVALLLLD